MTDAAARELGFASAEEAAQNAAAKAASNFDPSQVSGFDKAMAGAKAVVASPTAAFDFAKQNMMPLAAAASPIMADMMVPTTTKAPTPTAPGRIIEKRWDGRQFVPVASTDAGVFNSSGRTFSDFNRGYNDGGIVALADGGDVQHYYLGGDVKADLEKAYAANDVAKINEIASANKLTAGDIGDTYKGFDTSGIKGLQLYTPPAAPTYTQYTPEQMGSFLSNPVNKDIDIAAATKATNADPAAVNKYIAGLTTPFVGSTDTTGGSGTLGIYNNMVNKSISPDEYYAAAVANNPKYAGWTKDMIQKGYNLDKGAYALSAAEKDGVSDKEWAKFMDDNKYSVDDMAQAFGLSRNEVQRRYNDAKAIEKKVDKVVTTGGTDGTTTTAPVTYNTAGTNVPSSLESTLGLPPGVSGAGATTVNPNGTITTRPDFSLQMRDVRDAYTKGGGSLGYTSPSFTNIDDFTKKYVTDRMSGDSLDAYNYLSGKGGAQYPVKSRVGQISRPYDEAVLGYPARGNLPYIYNKATGKMDVNPDYVAPGRDDKGNVTYSMSMNDIKKVLTDKPLSGQALYDWAKSNNLSAQQISDATGRTLSSVYADFRAGAKATAAVTNPDGTIDEAKVAEKALADEKEYFDEAAYLKAHPSVAEELRTGKSVSGQPVLFTSGYDHYMKYGKAAGWEPTKKAAGGGLQGYALGGLGTLGGYSDGGRLLKGPGDGVSDSIPATIGQKQQPARLADGEFVVPARIVSELGNGSTDAGAKKLYAMMDRVQRARGKTTGKNKVAANSRADKYLPA
jgi:hypothetical protein